MPAGPRQLEQAAATRTALVAAGRRLFVRDGYLATGTEDLVAAAGVTRGALYHHFRDKRDLFRAVFNEIGADVLAGRIGAAPPPGAGGDPWDLLREGLHRFLRTAAEDPEVQRVTLIDGPAVLGWSEWVALEERYALDRIEAAVERSIEAGAIREVPARAVAHLLLGMVNSGALVVAGGATRSPGRDVLAALDALLDGLRRPKRRGIGRPRA